MSAAAIIALVTVAAPAPSGPRELRFNLWAEGATLAAVVGVLVTSEVLRASHDNTSRWDSTFGWERDLRDALLLDPGSRDDAFIAGEVAHWGLLAGGVAITEAIVLLARLDQEGAVLDALQNVYIVAVSVLVATTTSQLFKMTILRTRPEAYPLGGAAAGSSGAVHSWPSGHVTFAAAIATAYSTVLYLRGHELWWVAAIAGSVFTTTVVWARLAADKHWGADVLGGLALGIGTGIVYPLLAHPRVQPAGAVMVRPAGLGVRVTW